MRLFRNAVIVASAAFSLIAVQAAARSAHTCTTINGYSLNGNSNVTVTLNAGETITVAPYSYSVSINFENKNGFAQQCGPSFSGAPVCASASFTAPTAGDYNLEEISGFGPSTLSCAAGSAAAVPTGTTGKTVTAQGSGATISAGGSTNAIGGAIRNATSGSGPAVSTQGLFLTTGGTAGNAQGWAQIQGRNYNGDIDGRSFEFTVGTDFEVSWGTRIGVFISQGKSDLEINGTSVDSKALSFGPYIKSAFGDRYELTGYAFVAKPDYTVGTTSYEAKRRGGGLSVTADYSFGNTQVESFLGVSGYSESHPAAGTLAAREVSALTGSIGTKAIFATGSAFQPYLSLGADFTRYDDGVNGRQTHNSPRIGTGFTLDTGSGTLSMDLNGGQIVKDTRDVEFIMKYNLNF